MAYEFNHYYELQNVQTRKYVNILGNHEDGTVKNGETVNLFARTDNLDQRWALENYGGSGNVRIVLQRGEGWYALNYNVNANCIVWHLNTAEDTDTVITTIPVDGKANTYYFMLRDRSLYLTAVGTSLKWQPYTGGGEQMFTILEPGTGGDGGDEGRRFDRGRILTWLPGSFPHTRAITPRTAQRRAVCSRKLPSTIAPV